MVETGPQGAQIIGINAGIIAGSDVGVSGLQSTAISSSPVASRQLSQPHVWIPPSKVASGCTHLQEWMKKNPSWKGAYSTVLRYVNTMHLQRLSGKMILQRPACCSCGSEAGPSRRLLVSLHSVFVGCLETGCFKKQSQTTACPLSLDLDRGEVFCDCCNDYVYHSEVEEMRLSVVQDMETSVLSEIVSDSSASITSGDDHVNKKAKTEAAHEAQALIRRCIPERREWIPTAEQIKSIKEFAQGPENNGIVGGLRGFHNVGNTCFLNCVLQGLVHNPGVRDYFLGDYHNRHRCQHKREVEGKSDAICMGCEMDRLVNDFFQPHKQAYTPHHFLYGMWKSSQHLAGYEQQDAHECLISVLNALQVCCAEDISGRSGVIQELFSGRMRSDVTCLCCKTASITRDPFVDIVCVAPYASSCGRWHMRPCEQRRVQSLDLRHHIPAPPTSTISSSSPAPGALPASSTATCAQSDQGATTSLTASDDVIGNNNQIGALARGMWEGAFNQGGATGGDQDKVTDAHNSKSPAPQAANRSAGWSNGTEGVAAPSVSLPECLHWFTRVEKLGANSYKCGECNAYQEGLKQMSIQALAPSLCLQLKRFESLRHAGPNGGQQSFKVDTHVVFPIMLDMAPYLSSGVRRLRQPERTKTSAGDGSALSMQGDQVYAEDDDAWDEEHERQHAVTAGPVWYRLYAVVVHHGKLDSGHYTCFVRRGGDWFRCDDAAVVMVSEDEVLSSQAYLLLYTSAA